MRLDKSVVKTLCVLHSVIQGRLLSAKTFALVDLMGVVETRQTDLRNKIMITIIITIIKLSGAVTWALYL